MALELSPVIGESLWESEQCSGSLQTCLHGLKICLNSPVCAITANKIHCEQIEKLLEKRRISGSYLGVTKYVATTTKKQRETYMDFIITNELLYE